MADPTKRLFPAPTDLRDETTVGWVEGVFAEDPNDEDTFANNPVPVVFAELETWVRERVQVALEAERPRRPSAPAVEESWLGPRCQSCGAPIRWAYSETGKKIPLDAWPARGLVHLLDGGKGDEPSVVGVRPVWRTHFETCPNAKEHRR